MRYATLIMLTLILCRYGATLRYYGYYVAPDVDAIAKRLRRACYAMLYVARWQRSQYVTRYDADYFDTIDYAALRDMITRCVAIPCC